MNIMKLALLGTAAVAAVSVSARADELSDMKAQIEALNARVAQVEAAPAVPAGYQLLSIGKGPATVIPGFDQGPNAATEETVVSVMPTADMPASTTLSWNGYARSALIYSDVSGPNNDDFSVKARGQLNVTGKTDTAVGEVGAHLELRGNYHSFGDASVVMNNAWGWWAVTPELTLGGGYDGSLSGIGYGYDGKCNCYYTDNANAGYGHGDTTQMRLSWNSGPMSVALAIEDNSAKKSSLGAAGEMKFAGDMFSAELAGGYWTSHDYRVGAGAGFSLGDMANVSVSAGMGQSLTGTAVYNKWWKANILLSANLSDAVHGEIGFNHYESNQNIAKAHDENAVLAGIYYDPVDKLTIGLEGEWINPQGASNTSTQVDLITVYRF